MKKYSINTREYKRKDTKTYSKIKIKTLCLCIFVSNIFSLMAQTSIENVLHEIEQNNTILQALRQQAEAEKIGNKTGIYLANPEVEYHYLWGNNAEAGNRVDFNATQSFDFPSAYHYKNKFADGKNKQTDLKYGIERKNILLEARQLCIQLIYQQLLSTELKKRTGQARQMKQSYDTLFEKGEANILDRNKARLNLLNAEKAWENCQMEQDYLLAELNRMNGGITLEKLPFSYDLISLPDDFEQWFASISQNNLSLQYMQQEIALGKTQEKLQRSLNLPKLSAGYMSEKQPEVHLQGVVVGVSIPLWENKNTVRQIKAQTKANEATANDESVRFYNEAKALYAKADKLQKLVADYQENLSAVNNEPLLHQALKEGQISLVEYLLELAIYHEAVNNVLSTHRDLQLTIAELMQWQ